MELYNCGGWAIVSAYVSVRGWIECDEKQLDEVRKVAAACDDSYGGGWAIAENQFNWIRYAFYGGSVPEGVVESLLMKIRAIAQIPPSDADQDLIVGIFFVSHEIDGMTEWRVRDGRVDISDADTKYQYLDV